MTTHAWRRLARRPLLVAALAVPAGLLAQAPDSPGGNGGAGYAAEFDAVWDAVLRDYAYWDESATDWGRAGSLYRPRAEAARGPQELREVLAELMAELADPRARVLPDAATRDPLDTRDIWVEWREGKVVVTAVREGSAADRADVEPGMEILAVNGRSIEDLFLSTGPSALGRPDPFAHGPALRAMLADPPGEGRRLEVRTPRRQESTIRIDDVPPPPFPPRPPVVWEATPEGFAYVAIREMDSLDVVAQFDAAMDRYADAPGLLLDLRELPDGGNDAVVRGVLGRFVDAEKPYARRGAPGGKLWPNLDRRWIELVTPRGERPYRGPVVALVGRWTAGEAEDIAVGLDALGVGTIVGTPMAGVHGDTRVLTLPRSGLRVEFPVARPLHLDGTPREEYRPDVVVDVTSESARGADDPVRRAGLETLRELAGGG